MRPIVLISVDCLRADHLGCYGYDRPTTPNIDEFANKSTLYEHSYSNFPGTRLAFQALHTGVSTLQIDGLGIPEGYQSVASHLSEKGYITGGFAVNGFVSRDYRYDSGFDIYYSVQDVANSEGIIGCIRNEIDEVVNNETIRTHVLDPLHRLLRSYHVEEKNRFQPSHSDTDTVDQAISFIEQQKENAFFLWTHLMDVHTPYGYWPEHLKELRGDTEIEHTIHPGNEGRVTHGQRPPEEVIDTYDAGIRSADEQIGRLLDQIPDNATVIITGDHGEEFGRYGEFHTASVYSSMTQVPIIVHDPEIETGRSITPVQHLDLPPTILHAAGIDIPPHWSGTSLQTVKRSRDTPIVYAIGPNNIAIRAGKWKYVKSGEAGELYQVPHHGMEKQVSENSNKKSELKNMIDEYKSNTETVGEGKGTFKTDDELTDEVEDNLEDLGYL